MKRPSSFSTHRTVRLDLIQFSKSWYVSVRDIFSESRKLRSLANFANAIASFVSPQSMFVILQKRSITRNLNVFWNDGKRPSSIDCQLNVNQSPRVVQDKAAWKDPSHIRTLITIAKILFALARRAARSKQSLFDRGCIQIASLLALEYFYPGYIHIYISRDRKDFLPPPRAPTTRFNFSFHELSRLSSEVIRDIRAFFFVFFFLFFFFFFLQLTHIERAGCIDRIPYPFDTFFFTPFSLFLCLPSFFPIKLNFIEARRKT